MYNGHTVEWISRSLTLENALPRHVCVLFSVARNDVEPKCVMARPCGKYVNDLSTGPNGGYGIPAW